MPDRISIEITARDDASPVIEKAKKAFDELEKSLADSKQNVASVQETFDKASSAVAAFEQRIESSADIVRSAGAQYASVAASIGRDFGGNLAQTVRDSVSQIPAMMEGLGRDSTQMFARGMSSALGEVGKSASSIAGVISDYLELHSPAKKGPLSSDPSVWAKKLVQMLSTGLISAQDVLESSAEKLAGLFGGIGEDGVDMFANRLKDTLYTLYDVSHLGLPFASTRTDPAYIASHYKKQYDDAKNAKEYQAFYETMKRVNTAGLYSGFKAPSSFAIDDDLADTSFAATMKNSKIDPSTGLPQDIVNTEWFKKFVPKNTLKDINNRLSGNNMGISLVNGAIDQRDYNLELDEFLKKYSGRLNTSQLDAVKNSLGLGFEYNLEFFKTLFLSNDIGSAMEDSSQFKSARQLSGDFLNIMQNVDPGEYSASVAKTGIVSYFSNALRLLGTLDKKPGSPGGIGNAMLTDGNWGKTSLSLVAEFEKALASGKSLDEAAEEMAQGSLKSAIYLRQADLGMGKTNPSLEGGTAGTLFWKLADPDWVATHPKEAARILGGQISRQDWSNSSLAQPLTDAFSRFGSGKTLGGSGFSIDAVQINQNISLNLGDYDGDIRALIEEIAQDTVIETQRALLDLVNFRGV